MLCLCICTLFGCSNVVGNTDIEGDSTGKLSIVCTIFPQYDWVEEILGNQVDNVELTLLLDNGVDIHSYQPTVEDIAKIATCDMFIYVGGESDAWVEDALKEATNKDMQVINLMEVVGDSVRAEEIVEGMEAEMEAEVAEADSDEKTDSEAEEIEYDEHVWLSLKNAEVICNAISNSLSALDVDNRKTYKNNLETYLKKLSELDTDYQQIVNNAAGSTIVFGDRFPFRYLVDDYELEYYAAFVGCSAETEASFETILFLAEKVDELNLPVVCVIESADQSIAQTIINNTENKDQKILIMDSMQSVTAKDVENGADYLSIMESNLVVLKEALE